MRIKPCPFCGADTWLYRTNFSWGRVKVEPYDADGKLTIGLGRYTGTIGVKCYGCDAIGPLVKSKTRNKSQFSYDEVEHDVRKAVDAWNKRVDGVQERLDI